MALRSTKQHKHVFIVLGVVAGSLALTLFATSLSDNNFTKALTSRVIYIQPGANGLAHISSEKSQNSLDNTVGQAGDSVGRSIILQSAASDN